MVFKERIRMDDITDTQSLESRIKSISSRIYRHGLITEDEKSSIERLFLVKEVKAAIFDLLFWKESGVASRILQVMRSESEQLENGSPRGFVNPLLRTDNPMQNNAVLKCVFRYLGHNELKSSRIVCKKWNSIAEPFLREQGKIVFGLGKYGKTFDVAHFDETFGASTGNLNFTSFRFNSDIEWDICALKTFLRQQKNIAELEFYCVRIKNELTESPDISNWIADFPITKLSVTGFNENDEHVETNFTVAIDKLPFIKFINLSHCNVKVTEKGNRVSPVNVELSNVTFYQDGNKVDVYCINDCIDFHKAKHVDLSCCLNNDNTVRRNTTICLDLNENENVNADYLSLHQVSIVNWENTKWTVNSLMMYGMPFLSKTKMKVTEFHFQDSFIDISALPPEIERLNLMNATIQIVLCIRPTTLNLPNLKYLYVYNNAPLNFLFYFVNCPNLTDLCIRNADDNAGGALILDMEWIPKNVKRIKLRNPGCIQGEKLIVDTLILEDVSLLDATTIVEMVIPKVLVLEWDRKKYDENNCSVLVALKYFTILQPELSFYIGPFFWSHNYELSPLNNYVDKQGKYYVFKNQKGECIDYATFTAIKNQF